MGATSGTSRGDDMAGSREQGAGSGDCSEHRAQGTGHRVFTTEDTGRHCRDVACNVSTVVNDFLTVF